MNKRLGFVLGVMALTACGYGHQEGFWTPVDPGTTEEQPQITADIKLEPGSLTRVIETTVEPLAPETERHGVLITCKIPENLPAHQLIVAGQDTWIEGNDEQVCFGETSKLGEGFCRWVESHEARYRAIADCHRVAIRELDKIGFDLTTNMLPEGKNWLDVKHEYVPPAWTITPDQAVEDIGHFSGWMALLMDGTTAEVPATPFCFNKERDVSLRDARDATLFTIWWLYQLREAKSEWVLTSLKRGVESLINPNHRPLKIAVDVVVTPTKPNTPRCMFRLP